MASEKWAGFTDEDIVRIKTSPKMSSNRDRYSKDKSDPASIGTSGPMKLSNSNYKQDFLSDTSKDETSDSDPDVKRKPHRLKKNMKSKEVLMPSPENLNEQNCKDCEKSGNDLSDDSCFSSDTSKRENEEKSFESNTSMQELELFELRQKRIEAENARRRALINKAITDKKMQTQAEAMKLAKITQELKHLDSILSADVSILRDYIEKATAEFSDAEKRYLKAEREFIEAKLHLYEKMQRKEQLTEHLCAIIEQNENRKANKLVELMKQLEMEAIIEDYDKSDSQPILSKFCILNDEAYHNCTTLKPPSPKLTPESPVATENNQLCEQEPNTIVSANSSENIKGDVTEKIT
ncbi:hypothetical protein JTE90_002081 [Oedothorax gibbosus]|uniref:RAB6-interacting golgin n=1 Tax=Oedothorax gibbosus TaxID=931172 RepID=A0AAV6UDI3_9ARAC|nr:hypothetical protein JTE90_002081 [Oedothorax gibbosus]